MKQRRKLKRTFSHNSAALYEKALDLYLNENKPNECLRILFKLAKAHYEKAFREIGFILYREKHDVEKAEEWFGKAEKMGALLGEAISAWGLAPPNLQSAIHPRAKHGAFWLFHVKK